MFTASLAVLAFVVFSGLAAASLTPPTRSRAQFRTVYAFPNSTFVENLAIRPNSQNLVTSLSLPQLWLVDPHLPNEASVVHEFDALGLSGIVEY